MATFISMLRGINVSGQKKIMMPDLKTVYKLLGFSKVNTYIQSGNVMFSTENRLSTGVLSALIHEAILEKFGFNVPVIIRTAGEMEAVISANPFAEETGVNEKKLYVTFLDEEPQSMAIQKIRPFDFLPDKFHFNRREIYLNCASGYGTTKLSNTFFENKLKVKATTRNWKTVNKLLELVKETES
jgi:uncharacterized protein (DUF1697 family)